MTSVVSEFVEHAIEGAPGETRRIALLPIAEILMPGFQRERIQTQIAKLASEWDETAASFPVVAVYKQTMWGLDGQQRLAAAESLERMEIQCILIEGIRSYERLANLFLKFNRDRRLLNAFQKYVAAHAAKDRGTLEISRILEGFGLEAGKSGTGSGKVPIGAVTAIHSRGGSDLLNRVLMARSRAWGDKPSREANEGKTLQGLATFLARYWEKVEDDRLVKMLGRHHPGYLLEATDQTRGTFHVAYSDYLRDLYNKGLRGKGRL